MRAVKRINPIYLLIVLNILLIVFRDLILPESVTATISEQVELTLAALGVFGYVIVVGAFAVCSFFFVPLLIPFNILCGALYGPYTGTAVALAGITASCIASTISARHVFTGMQSVVDRRPGLQRIIRHADKNLNLTIAMVRFAVVVPYLVQNIALAVTQASVTRLALVTAVSALPGAAIYSLLGAGLVQANDLRELLAYIGLPVLIMIVVAFALGAINARNGSAPDEGDRKNAQP